jgi:diadenylate cyclase
MLKRHLTPETMERLLRNELLGDPQDDKKSTSNPLFNLLFGRNKKEDDLP